MKSIFTLFIVFCSISFLNCQSLTFINGYTNKAFEKCNVKVHDSENKFLFEKQSDSLGKVFFENKNEIRIRANSLDEKFIGVAKIISFENVSDLVIYLFPNEKYEQEILKIEDSLYGNEEEIDLPEEEAKFNGSLNTFIVRNLYIPNEENYHDFCSKIYVQFIVEIDGTISHVKNLRSCDGYKLFPAEVLRLVRSMPKWIPGKNNGINKRTYMRLPINITLN